VNKKIQERFDEIAHLKYISAILKIFFKYVVTDRQME
jgi:hypothetical protein